MFNAEALFFAITTCASSARTQLSEHLKHRIMRHLIRGRSPHSVLWLAPRSPGHAVTSQQWSIAKMHGKNRLIACSCSTHMLISLGQKSVWKMMAFHS
jgi:hypothetical protein